MNKLTPKLITGTMGELLVQARLLQFDVQAAPPLKDTGNDLIAIRGCEFRAIQVKTTDGDTYAVPNKKRRYHILAAVRLVGEENDVQMDRTEIYLIRAEELPNLSRRFEDIPHLRLSGRRIDELFPRETAATDGTEFVESDRSHVIVIPTGFPFNHPQWRWTTFLGKVVKPLMQGRQALYWFTYYTDHARLRIRTTEREHAEVQSHLDELMQKFKLEYKKNDRGEIEEAAYSMEGDLGGGRFLSHERRDISPLDRGLLVLQMLHDGGQLFLDTLVEVGPFWREEDNKDANSAYGSSSRSYLHLLHNLARSDIPITVCEDVEGKKQALSDYYYNHAVGMKRVVPKDWPTYRVRV